MVMQVEVIKYEEKGFDVMGYFNARIGLGAEDRPNNGKSLLDLVRLGKFVVGNNLQCCEDRLTWESGEKKSIIDSMLFGKGLDVIKMVVEDSGNLDIRSDHNLIWGEVVRGGQKLKELHKW